MIPNQTFFFNNLASIDPISILNLLLISLTLFVSYFAYRTQRLSTRVLDAKNTDQSTDFLIQNSSHTSHVVLRIKMRVWLHGDTAPRDMEEFSLDPNRSPVDYLYPSRSGTSRLPEIAYRAEVGPLDFTRFRTLPSNVTIWPTTTLKKSEITEDGFTELHFGPSENPMEVHSDDIESLREIYRDIINAGTKKQNHLLPPYIIPIDAEKIRLEVQQTGEIYDLVPKDDSWKVVSKRNYSIKIDGNEYSIKKNKISLLNLYYMIRYNILHKLSVFVSFQHN